MSVRFNRQGVGVVNDHNDLANKGTRTHSEIDSYMAELDAVRGLYPSIGARLDAIEQKNTGQDITLTDHEGRLDAAEPKITQLETDMNAVEGDLSTLTGRVTTAEGNISSQGTEIANARGTYATLKERIDAAGGGGGGSLIWGTF